MGEGLKQMFFVSSSPSSPRAEDDDEVGENSDPDEAGGESSPKDSSLGHRHEFSGLVSHLPVKKGLSKFYHGKSQSFSSLSDVRTAEDLAKKETTIKRAMKPCRSYAGGLNHDETDSAPTSKAAQNNKAMIAKKGNPRSSCAHLIARTTSGSSYFAGSKPPAIPTHNKRLA